LLPLHDSSLHGPFTPQLKSAQAFKQVLKFGLVLDLSRHFHSFAFILGHLYSLLERSL